MKLPKSFRPKGKLEDKIADLKEGNTKIYLKANQLILQEPDLSPIEHVKFADNQKEIAEVITEDIFDPKDITRMINIEYEDETTIEVTKFIEKSKIDKYIPTLKNIYKDLVEEHDSDVITLRKDKFLIAMAFSENLEKYADHYKIKFGFEKIEL